MVGELILAALAGYLLGSIPGAHLVGRAAGVDLRTSGSGNVGASNVARLVGFWPAFAAFVIDAAKALAAVAVAAPLGVWPRAVAALSAIAGHNWPPWLRFRGGRGLAVLLVAGVVVAPWGALVLVSFLTLGVAVRRLAELALVGMVAFPVAAAVGDGAPGAWYAVGAAVLGIVRRLQGSPQIGEATLREAWWSRLVYDREPAATPDRPAAEEPGDRGSGGPLR